MHSGFMCLSEDRGDWRCGSEGSGSKTAYLKVIYDDEEVREAAQKWTHDVEESNTPPVYLFSSS